jgi:acetyl-CoA C-acetyltransferase
MSTRHIVLSHPVRTAIGAYNGTLKSVPAVVIAALTSKRPAAQLRNA